MKKFIHIYFSVFVLICSVSCDPWKLSPELMVSLKPIITSDIIEINGTSVSISINTINNSGTYITEIGICLSTKPQPTINDSIRNKNQPQAIIDMTVSNLMQDTTYYFMPFATNAHGTTYGKTQSFRTSKNDLIPFNPYLSYGYMNDIDGNTYRTIKIGNQTWMAQNLRVSRYNNGDSIPLEKDFTRWSKIRSGAQCPYENSTSKDSIAKYGRYYNHLAVTDQRQLAPTGWHLPSVEEWKALEDFLIRNGYNNSHNQSSNDIGKSLASQKGWAIDNLYVSIGNEQYKNNKAGFTALPSGKNEVLTISNRYQSAYWWCIDKTNIGLNASYPTFCKIDYERIQLSYQNDIQSSNCGFCVRCVKD